MPSLQASIVPRSRDQLSQLVLENMSQNGPRCDLNHIDVSEMTYMDSLFKNKVFNGNISKWDVSHVSTFDAMFENCPFNGDISQWNTQSAKSMERMFAKAQFTGDLSRWNVSKNRRFNSMFFFSDFNSDISTWDMRQAMDLKSMFKNAAFSRNISEWHVPENADLRCVFEDNPKGAAAQTMTPFILNVLLQNGNPLPDLKWRLAVKKYRKLKDTLGLDPSTMTTDIVSIHAERGKALDVLSLDGLDLDSSLDYPG